MKEAKIVPGSFDVLLRKFKDARMPNYLPTVHK